MKRYLHSAAAVLLAAVIAVPVFAARGSADFSNFVALGDSYGAGFESSSLNERHQPWSWPAVIARQAGLRLCTPSDTATSDCWAMPLVSFPGIANELLLQSIAPPSPVIAPAPGQGQPLMLTFGRPYNNLSIPGATVGALLGITGAEPPSPNEPTPVSFGRFILRGQGTAVQQAVAQHPTFIALWIGGSEADYNRFRPVIDAIGDKPNYIGDIGSGSIAKLVHNAAGYALNTALAELFTAGVKAGVPPLALWSAIRKGANGQRRADELVLAP